MKALMFDFSIPKIILRKARLGGRYICMRYRDSWPVPAVTGPHQVLVKTILGGICASDIHQMDVDMSMYASVISSRVNPLLMGHEAVGRVCETGRGVRSFAVGDRVVYNPVARCRDWRLAPCPSCRRGNYQHCFALAGIGVGNGVVVPFGGFGGGGFGEYILGLEGQFIRVPDTVPDEIAVLAEPFTIALHAVARNMPGHSDSVIVTGAGIIGLLTVTALRLLGSRCRIISLARYPSQAAMAVRLGADETVSERGGNELYQRVAAMTGGTLLSPIMSRRVVYGNRGPDIIFDCVASESSIDDDLRLVRSNGRIVIVGMGYGITRNIDWSLQVWKEIDIVGSLFSGRERYRGKDIDAFDLALGLMARHPAPFNGLLTHTFPIERYRDAVACATSKKKRGALKVAFDYR